MPRQVLSFRNALEEFNKEQLIYVLIQCNLCKEDRKKIVDELIKREMEMNRLKVESAQNLKAEVERIIERRKGKASKAEMEALQLEIENCNRRIKKYTVKSSNIEREAEEWITQATR